MVRVVLMNLDDDKGRDEGLRTGGLSEIEL